MLLVGMASDFPRKRGNRGQQGKGLISGPSAKAESAPSPPRFGSRQCTGQDRSTYLAHISTQRIASSRVEWACGSGGWMVINVSRFPTRQQSRSTAFAYIRAVTQCEYSYSQLNVVQSHPTKQSLTCSRTSHFIDPTSFVAARLNLCNILPIGADRPTPVSFKQTRASPDCSSIQEPSKGFIL